MPFKSQAQRAYLYAQHPSVAKEFQKETPKGKSLPDRVSKQRKAMKEYAKGK